MTFSALLTALRRHWVLLVASVLAGLIAAAAVVVFSPRVYAGTASVYVTAVGGSGEATATSLQDAYQGTLLAQQKIKSYPGLVLSDRVLFPVIDRFGLDDSTSELADRVSVVADGESTLLRVTVEDRSAERAADLANAITTEFIDVVDELEQPGGRPAQVSVEVVDEARASDDPVSPRVALTLAVGLALGVLLGCTAAVVREASARRSDGSAEEPPTQSPASGPHRHRQEDQLGAPLVEPRV
ncbi:YveK family protein [Blastococcus sp. URHD0036]|uniref:YveK family protein n=1 Tax=Blastococcus sp. URHD0036 TaxID=1380356 RepID=UPI000691E6AE|nr:Wzz/FepE/Etk N-terminal domain-containing protein [Blastococcus sp. URHD0036]